MAAIPSGYFQTSYRGDLAIRKTFYQKARLVVMALLLLGLPFLLSPFALDVTTAIALAVPGAIALSLLTGVAGQISLGNAAFMGIGATVAAMGGAQHGLPFPVVLVLAAVTSGVIGAAVGMPSLRVRGLYLIIATLSLHFIIVYLIRRIQSAEVGEGGFILPAASIGGFAFDRPEAWYYLLMAFAVLTVLLHVNLVRGRAGRAWLAIRERDIAAEILGVNVAAYKIRAFVLTSMIIGVQGALYAYYIGVVNYEAFNLNLAISYVAMIILGGLGSHVGAIYGAAFVTALPYLITSLFERLPGTIATTLQGEIFEIQAGLYGLLVIAFLIFEPAGLAALTGRVRKYFALWPFSRERLGGEGS